MAAPLLGHKLTKMDMAAALIAYSGVYVIATAGYITDVNFNSPTGIALALISIVIWCLYWLVNTKNKGDPVVSLLLSFIIGLPFIITALLITSSLPNLSLNALLAGMYIGLFEMGITFVLWLMALKQTQKTANIRTMVFLTPVLSVCIIAWILNETITISTYIGLSLIISGLALQQIVPRYGYKAPLKNR